MSGVVQPVPPPRELRPIERVYDLRAIELERLEPQPGPLFIEAARFASAAPAGGIATVIFGLADPYEDGV